LNNHTLVLGIGNTLLSDEGAGVHMLDYLRDHFPDLPGVQYLDGGTLSFTLAAWIEDAANLIVVDAAELDARPGTVQVFRGEAMDRFAGKTKRSVHEVSLGDLLSIAHLTGTLPANRALVAIQPQTMAWGSSLSDVVAHALPGAAQQAVDLIMEWQTGRRGQGASNLQTQHR
jgi:hydrogenase maturation protease